ncbi:hypothetical protein [Eisenbergiella sp.]
MILETERLILREMGQADFHDLAEILQEPKLCMPMNMIFLKMMFRNGLTGKWIDIGDTLSNI